MDVAVGLHLFLYPLQIKFNLNLIALFQLGDLDSVVEQLEPLDK